MIYIQPLRERRKKREERESEEKEKKEEKYIYSLPLTTTLNGTLH